MSCCVLYGMWLITIFLNHTDIQYSMKCIIVHIHTVFILYIFVSNFITSICMFGRLLSSTVWYHHVKSLHFVLEKLSTVSYESWLSQASQDSTQLCLSAGLPCVDSLILTPVPHLMGNQSNLGSLHQFWLVKHKVVGSRQILFGRLPKPLIAWWS